MNIYEDPSLVEDLTKQVIDKNIRVLQAGLIGGTEKSHAKALLDMLYPKQNATILDMGAGIGEIQRYWLRERPDLFFYLNNISPYQLSLCPTFRCQHIHSDFNKTFPIKDKVDVIMFQFSLGHVQDIDWMLEQVRAHLNPDGIIFIVDFEHDDPELVKETLGYVVYPLDKIENFNTDSSRQHFKLWHINGSTKHLEGIWSKEHIDGMKGYVTRSRF